MSKKRTTRFISFVAALTLAMLACNAVSGGTPPPEPTAVPPVDVPTTAPEPTQALEPTEAPTEAGSADVPGIEILEVNGFLDSFDAWVIVGLIRNNTDRAIDNIEVEVELFDAADNSLYVDTTYADLYNLAPGEITPFSMTVWEEVPDADNFLATIVGNSNASSLERTQADIGPTLMAVDEDGDVYITGEIFNNTGQPLYVSGLAAATFDAEGALISAESTSTMPRYLDPNDSGPFRITVPGSTAGDIVDSYQVYIDAEVEDPVDPIPIAIGGVHDYLDAFDSFHLVTSLTNEGSLSYNISLLAGIYDADGNVLDAATVDLAIDALAPGETAPLDFQYWGPLNYVDGQFDKADTYTIQIEPYWTWDTDIVLVELATQNDANEFDDYGGTFTGEILNNTATPMDSATIIIYFVDLETDEVIGVGYDWVFDEIPAGSAVEYTVHIDTPEGFDPNSAQYFIIVNGEPLE